MLARLRRLSVGILTLAGILLVTGWVLFTTFNSCVTLVENRNERDDAWAASCALRIGKLTGKPALAACEQIVERAKTEPGRIELCSQFMASPNTHPFRYYLEGFVGCP